MNPGIKVFRTIVSLTVLACSLAQAQEPTTPTQPLVEDSLRKDAVYAMRLATQWLERGQQENGCWSNASFPAITALAVSAILHTPDVRLSADLPASVLRGREFILSCVQSDGAIYQPLEGIKGGGLPNYNTALCVMALHEIGDPADAGVIENGRRWLIESQYLGPGVYRGGMGYDPAHERPYADLSNTVLALEALRATEPAEAGVGERLDWEAAIEFVTRCQHLREYNEADWVSDAPQERGGFVYHPEKSMAGEAESSDEEGDYLRSYGSMTYAGLLSFIYADVDQSDPRVRAAYDWIRSHWTLDENPRMGEQGLYYYYHTMAKALDLMGGDQLESNTGETVAWRPALAQKLVELQRIDPETGFGYWQNDNNRWWENDPNLTTAYTLRSLAIACYGPLGKK